MSEMELERQDVDEAMSDAESEGSYNLAWLFTTLDIAVPANNAVQRLRQADRLSSGDAESFERIYNQLAEYEQEIAEAEQRAYEAEGKLRTAEEQLHNERRRSKLNEAHVKHAQRTISSLEAALEEAQRKAMMDMKHLEARYNQQKERSAKLLRFIHDFWRDLQERENQSVEDAEDKAQFREKLREVTRRSEEQRLQLSSGMKRMEELMRTAQPTAVDSRNHLSTGFRGNAGWGQGSLLNSGGSIGVPGAKALTWTGPVNAPVDGGRNAAKPVGKPRLTLLERSKYIGRPQDDSDSYTLSPSPLSIGSPAFSDLIDGSPVDSDTNRFSFKSASAGKRPLALELGLDSQEDLQFMDGSYPPTPQTYPTKRFRSLSVDSGLVLDLTGEDDEQTSAGTSFMQLVPRKRMRFTSPSSCPSPEAGVTELSDGDGDGDDDDNTPASPTKRMRTTHSPPVGFQRDRQVVRESPPRAMFESNSKKNVTASQATQVSEESLQPIPPPRPVKQLPSIIHRHLEDLPFRSFRTQTEWTRRISFPINPPAVAKLPTVAVRVANEQPKEISKQAKPELPKTLTMPGEWPRKIISEAYLNLTEIHPIGHAVDSVKNWLVTFADERPHELACGIFAIGSLFWVWLGHQSHSQWLAANEVPLAVLMKLRSSPASMGWTDRIGFDVMRLLNVDRVMLG